VDTLTKFLSSRVKAEVLRLLFGLDGRELHLRELARQAGLNAATVRQELKRLSGLGLVAGRRNGNRTYFRAETGHPLYPDIRNLVLKTSGLVDVVRQALARPEIRVAFVFGSVASASEKAGSDVDLMVVGSTSLREVTDLLEGVEARIGREINPHVLTPQEFASRRKKREHFLTTVLSAPKLFVIGNEDDLAEVA
jgi:predicted nucleotidyltransferase